MCAIRRDPLADVIVRLAGAGRQAHWFDERHQNLIHDIGEQLTGRR
jgi:hypothetical protein